MGFRFVTLAAITMAFVSSAFATPETASTGWDANRVRSLAMNIQSSANSAKFSAENEVAREPGKTDWEKSQRRRAVDDLRRLAQDASSFYFRVLGATGPDSSRFDFYNLDRDYNNAQFSVSSARLTSVSIYGIGTDISFLRSFY